MCAQGAGPDQSLDGSGRYPPEVREFIDGAKLANEPSSRTGADHWRGSVQGQPPRWPRGSVRHAPAPSSCMLISGTNVSDESSALIAEATASISMPAKTIAAPAMATIGSVCNWGKTTFKFSERR